MTSRNIKMDQSGPLFTAVAQQLPAEFLQEFEDTYAKEGVYYVFTAPSYKVTVARGTRTVAWKEFSDKLALAVEERLKARL